MKLEKKIFKKSDFGHTWTVASQWKCCTSLGEASKPKASMHLSYKTHNTYFNVKHPKGKNKYVYITHSMYKNGCSYVQQMFFSQPA